MNCHEKLNYIEFPSKRLDRTKAFFETVFDWHFTDYGPDYTAFSNAGLEGGFFKSELSSTTNNGGH
jgi:predicted enzyme related to lactoylglutathione lyase